MLLNWGNSQGLNALMNSAEFIAGFADKGSGEVDLVLSKGTGSATFTRATTATTVNSAGTIISVASGTPRSYYDPTTLQYLGYLAEGARTNLCLQSADFGTTWGVSGTTVATNSVSSPAGDLTADAVVNVAAAGTHSVLQSISVSAGVNYAFSVFLKQNTLRYASISIGSVATGEGGYAIFDLQSATVTQSGASSAGGTFVSASVKSFPNGWCRCTVIASQSTTSVFLMVGTSNSATPSVDAYGRANYTGNTAENFYAWGAQLEAGSFASSYIPTTTASVPRNADVLTYPQSGNVSTTQGSAYAEILALWNSGGVNPQAIIKTGTTGQPGTRILVSITSAADNIQIWDGTNVNFKAVSNFSTAQRRAASSWGSAGLFITAAGATAATTAFDGDLGGAGLAIGSSTDGGEQFFGCIRNVRIYQAQLSASQLQAVTA